MLGAVLLAAFVPLASAHFRFLYPLWRADSLGLSKPGVNNITQYQFPCAGIDQTSSDSYNRTLWPLTGGSIIFNSSHPSALAYVNLGVGDIVSSFNVSLVPVFNETGPGVICLPHVGQGSLSGLKISDGTNATIQVITTSAEGMALYNCADITFSSNATVLANSQCQNGTGVGGVAIGNLVSGNGSNASSSAGNSTSKNAAGNTYGAIPVSGAVMALAMGIAAFLS